MTAVEVRQDRAGIGREAVLRAVGLNVRDPNAQALLLVCERYGLDPLLKHMVLIQSRPYVTRDGYLHIAHESKALDGIEILDEGETDEHWWAVAAVHRKDMGRPFTYRGRYPKSGSNKSYGPEMAIKCAEVAALRRAFNVTGVGAADEAWDSVEPVEPALQLAALEDFEALMERVRGLHDPADQEAFVEWKNAQGFVWHPGYTVGDVAAMATKLDEVTEPGSEPEPVGEGDAAGPAPSPESEAPDEPVPPTPPVAGESGASEPLPPADDEEALARTPCHLCGSTTSQRVLVGDHVRCQRAKACEKRVADQQQPFE